LIEIAAEQLQRDLLWCIASPELLNQTTIQQTQLNPFFANRTFTECFVRQVNRALSDLLIHEPQWMHHQLSVLKTKRLGERFEVFVRLAFELHPDYRVLAHNFPIRDSESTLGELDLLVADRNDRITHLELACKFYLQVICDHRTVWLGPGLKDRLDVKLDKLLNHQLLLSNIEACRVELQQRGWFPLTSKSLLKGRQFYALSEEEGRNADFAWGTAQQIRRCYGHKPWQWLRLDKEQWLAPVGYVAEEYSQQEPKKNSLAPRTKVATNCKTSDLNAILKESIQWPVQLAALSHRVEVKRLFWVPDDWYDRALDSLAS
jgi:hypothetical protein